LIISYRSNADGNLPAKKPTPEIVKYEPQTPEAKIRIWSLKNLERMHPTMAPPATIIYSH